jgi:hypothetical protein
MISKQEEIFRSQYPNAEVSDNAILVKNLKDISDDEFKTLIYFKFGWNNPVIRRRNIHSISLTSTQMEEIREKGQSRQEEVTHELVLLFNQCSILISDTYTTDYNPLYDIFKQMNYLVSFTFLDEFNKIVKYDTEELIEKGWAKYIN